jgi:2-phosphosulfolactate phosphatase
MARCSASETRPAKSASRHKAGAGKTKWHWLAQAFRIDCRREKQKLLNPMTTTLEVLFAPAEYALLHERDLRQTVCVVFDVLRATSTMVTALGNGATAIVPVAEIPEALDIRKHQPDVLLAGERDGVRIEGRLTGGVSFDLGNSPREFTTGKVSGRTIVMTTTNGTRALRACAPASAVLLGAFLNLRATAEFIEKQDTGDLLLVCSGTHDQASYEDLLGAGALCDLLWPKYGAGAVADSAHIARRLFRLEQSDLLGAVAQSRNGRRLMAHPDLRKDVPCCLQRDLFRLVAGLGKDGAVRIQRSTGSSASAGVTAH